MIDIELIRREPSSVLEALRKREDDVDLEPILSADRERRELLQKVEELRSERNRIAKEIGGLRRDGKDAGELEATATSLRDEIAALDPTLESTEGRLKELLLALPNIPDEQVPLGGKESNQVVKVWGEKPDLPEVRDHVQLSTELGLVDYAAGAKLGGSGFWVYTGMGAALEWATINFFCREHLRDGYEFLLPPHLLLEECGYATGQFPKFYDDVYHLERADDDRSFFLLPTSETAILNIHRDEILDEDSLPIKAFAYTPCYRRESFGHRAEERGTVRGHQFNKVEIFQFVAPEETEQALAEIVGKAESIVEQLGIHYRTSLLAARDASASMAITYDVEAWIPSIGTYKEVSSASAARDYQARRANIRFRRKGEKRPTYLHTLNASALATSRLVPAMLEQFQQPDGSVRVPEPLRDWLGTDVLTPPA
jgi:seryl-tRNA synthetase